MYIYYVFSVHTQQINNTLSTSTWIRDGIGVQRTKNVTQLVMDGPWQLFEISPEMSGKELTQSFMSSNDSPNASRACFFN